jgi:hypothetical protein
MEAIVEFFIFIYFITLNCFIFDIFSEKSEIFEWICVSIMIFTVSLLALVNISRSIYQLVQKLKRFRKSPKVLSMNELNLNTTDPSPKLDNTAFQANLFFHDHTGASCFYDSLSLRRDKKKITQAISEI